MKRTLLILIIILGIIFRIWASQPTWINGDENFNLSIYQNYVDRGELTPYMWRVGGGTNITAGGGTGYGILVLIGWMSIFGESLLVMRMLMILAGLISAYLYYLIAKEWWQSELAGIAALVFGIVGTSSFYSLVGRMDALAILSYSLLLLVHIHAVRQEKKWPHFLVGAIAILNTEFHILGLLYVGAMALFYGIRYFQMVLNERKLILNRYPLYFFMGAGLFGVIYIIIHILPDPQAFFIIPNTCDVCFDNTLKLESLRLTHVIGHRPIEFILILMVFYSEIKYRKTNQHFLILFVGYLISQIIVGPPPYIHYFHHINPILSIGVGGFFSKLISESKQERQDVLKRIFLIISLLLLGLNLMYFLFEKAPFENAYLIPDTPEIDYIQEHIPPSTVILSSAYYFYPLREYRNFLDYYVTLNYGLTLRNEKLEDFLNRTNPKVVYLDQISYEKEILEQFIEERNFVRMTPDLWVSQELVPSE